MDPDFFAISSISEVFTELHIDKYQKGDTCIVVFSSFSSLICCSAVLDPTKSASCAVCNFSSCLLFSFSCLSLAFSTAAF